MKFKSFLLSFVLLLAMPAFVQAQSPCGPPTPGQPHVCLTFVGSTTPGTATNIYRATTAGAENYATPLNPSPLPATTLFFYDKTAVFGSTYFYTAAAVGTGGVLSVPSPEVSAQIPVPPNPPTSPAATID